MTRPGPAAGQLPPDRRGSAAVPALCMLRTCAAAPHWSLWSGCQPPAVPPARPGTAAGQPLPASVPPPAMFAAGLCPRLRPECRTPGPPLMSRHLWGTPKQEGPQGSRRRPLRRQAPPDAAVTGAAGSPCAAAKASGFWWQKTTWSTGRSWSGCWPTSASTRMLWATAWRRCRSGNALTNCI